MSAIADRFRELHHQETPLLLPNPWDAGSAKVLTTLGFEALATTSGGHAHTEGRLDGRMTRDEVLEHAAAVVSATDLPVSCDFEDGFGVTPDEVAESVRLAAETGLAGLSIEDYTRDPDDPLFDVGLATERVAAAVEAGGGMVITGRAENFLRGRPDLDDAIARLQAYAAAGAGCVYAPFVTDPEMIRRIVDEVDAPVNVLFRPDGPTVGQLAEMGVARVSVGAAFHLATLGYLEQIAAEFRDEGTYGFAPKVIRGVAMRDESFGE